MIAKEILEELRGEKLTYRASPDQIPCTETSDPERLCKNPLVSVLMITYNHESYIAQAIEGILAQQTDFEFELIIGEDASKDKTREICFEYQKKHPEKIRVLWSEKNVNHLNGNMQRVRGNARGAFFAYCEGDDYWTDPQKLQRQVELLRKYPQAGICFSGTDYYFEKLGKTVPYDPQYTPEELVPGRLVCERVLAGPAVSYNFYANARHISGLLIRRSIFEQATEKFRNLMTYHFRFGDTVWITCITALSDACFYRKSGSVYRLNTTGITHWGGARLMRDADIFGILALADILHFSKEEAIDFFADKLVLHWANLLLGESPAERKRLGKHIASAPHLRNLFLRPHCWLLYLFIRCGRLTKMTLKIARAPYILYASIRKKRNKKRFWSSK